MNNKRFLFLVAWVAGSPSAIEHDDVTDVHDQEDLFIQYTDSNESVLVVEVLAPNAAIADAIGWKHAISENGGSYTMNDTVSMIREIPESVSLIPMEHNIEVPRFTVTDDDVVEDTSG